MERIKAFYPAGTEKIVHIGKNGNSYYLDAIDIPLSIHEKLTNNPAVEIVSVNNTNDSILFNSHSPELLASYKTGEPRYLAESSGLMWNKDFYGYIQNAAWAAMFSAEEALKSGKSIAITSGGHHAQYETGLGFEPTGKMVIVAKELISRKLVERVAILDLDVHFANGTHSLSGKNDSILSCDLWKYRLPKWKYTQNGKNIFHLKVENSKDYNQKLDRMFHRIEKFCPDILLIMNGLDVLQSDRMGGVLGFDEVELDHRSKVVGEFIKKGKYPTTVFVGGGYVDYSKPENEIITAKNQRAELYIKSIFSILGLQ